LISFSSTIIPSFGHRWWHCKTFKGLISLSTYVFFLQQFHTKNDVPKMFLLLQWIYVYPTREVIVRIEWLTSSKRWQTNSSTTITLTTWTSVDGNSKKCVRNDDGICKYIPRVGEWQNFND
jgi:hypothetical protein